MNKERLYLVLLGFSLIVFFVSMRMEWNRKPIEDDFARTAREYIETLTQTPEESLSTEQKLLLLHSYYVVQNYEAVIQISKKMDEELSRLSKIRFRAFNAMIQDAYRKSNLKPGRIENPAI